MAITPGFSEYADDRDPSTTAQLRDNDPRTKTDWFTVQRTDSNSVTTSYLFGKQNYQGFKQLMARHDAEFNAWMAGGDA